MRVEKMERLRVPDELFIDELLELYPADDIEGFNKDKVYFICESIYRGMEKFDENDIHPDKREKYFVPLSTKILRKVLGGSCYKGILDWMQDAGIIKPDGRWETGKVAQGYRFSDYFKDLEPT